MVIKRYIAISLGFLICVSITAALWVPASSLVISAFEIKQPSFLTITIKPGNFNYRLSGDFTKNNKPIDAPLREISFNTPLVVMKYLVSEADYQHCVEARSCKPLARKNIGRSNYPVTGISWEDATDYAQWVSQKTGQSWRLPSDEEWAYMAGSKFKDDALGLGEEADIAQRWIAKYEQESLQASSKDLLPQPLGTFEDNEYGVADVSANIWEWTNSCFTRHSLPKDGSADQAPFTVCGIRIAAGKHRAYISDFIRDARGGGCAVGTPPSYLGLRLIRDNPPDIWQKIRANADIKWRR